MTKYTGKRDVRGGGGGAAAARAREPTPAVAARQSEFPEAADGMHLLVKPKEEKVDLAAIGEGVIPITADLDVRSCVCTLFVVLGGFYCYVVCVCGGGGCLVLRTAPRRMLRTRC